MHDDEAVDRLLRDAMASDEPQLSPGFDDRVSRRLRPRRLTTFGRAAITIYLVVAVASAVWWMRDLDAPSILAALAIGVPFAAGAGAYARRLALGD